MPPLLSLGSFIMHRSVFRAAPRHLQSATRLPIATGSPRNVSVRGYATAFNWEDPLVASDLYTEEELAIQDTARQYCQERLLPRVLGMFVDSGLGAETDVIPI